MNLNQYLKKIPFQNKQHLEGLDTIGFDSNEWAEIMNFDPDFDPNENIVGGNISRRTTRRRNTRYKRNTRSKTRRKNRTKRNTRSKRRNTKRRRVQIKIKYL